MSNKIKISCDEATSICNKNQYGEANIWDKIKLSLHLLMCKHCKAYSSQNTLITKILGKHLNSCDSSNHLTEEEKNILEVNLNQKREE